MLFSLKLGNALEKLPCKNHGRIKRAFAWNCDNYHGLVNTVMF